MKKVWMNNRFQGHWPVGTAAIVVAEDADDAAKYLNAQLEQRGLGPCSGDQFEQLQFKIGEVVILNDGNY